MRKGIVEIDRSIGGLSWLVVVHTPCKSVRQLLRNQWRNLRRNGWRWIPYQLADVWNRVRPRSGPSARAVRPGKEFSVAALAARPNVRVIQVADIHAGETLEAVEAFDPYVGISLAAPILRRALFAIPTVGTVNLHKGKVPDYRGMPPAFWELWNDENSIGCTVHWVDDRLDTGEVAAETVIERETHSTLRGLQLRLDEIGVELMRGVIGEIVSGKRPSTPQPAGGSTYRKPTLAQMAALNNKLGRKNPDPRSLARRFAKAALSVVARRSWQLGANALLQPRITVLLYHRVNDAVRDNLTVGIEQFDRQMSLLRRHCHVLSIEEVLASRTIARSSKPLVCVTFDDGYLDNYVHAVPSLLRHEIPAAFFVSTGIVNSDRRFAHDVRRGNPFIPMMQWEQLRQMCAAGFTIGSHTVSHIDCASESADVVRHELVQSLADLRRELGLQDCIFAYPYGGRQYMTQDRLDMVKQAGYSGCLSAYGGSNLGGVDPFNVVRRGIHWAFSDEAFLFECVGLA
ncbi:MAG: polysaccharide deacetylase family protein [Candidatus Accumulibacter sp.]|uniref:Polysaccharide deacetylase family protein n=1 Tax=Candidatus Accumulibacter proximus TaxID=2954385 RepID=A0A935PXE4_9PROT|nr:polysaccharide deacetylase family protein [Candidatus Accumulibacter proximus]